MTAPAAIRFPPGGGAEFPVVVSAGASRSGVTGLYGEALKVAVRAAPERGRANAEVEEVLAGFFGVPRGAVEVVAGHTARRKRVRIAGIGAAAWRERLTPIMKPS